MGIQERAITTTGGVRMNAKSAAETLLNYVKNRQGDREFTRAWFELTNGDPKFRAMIRGYETIRRRADQVRQGGTNEQEN